MAGVVVPQLRKASHYATDKAIGLVKTKTRSTIRAAGLGGLANAVDTTSSLRKKRTEGNAWGAVFAKGGEHSRANQALMSYTQGAVITPHSPRKWLAYATQAAGRVIRLPRGGGGFANFRNLPRLGGVKLSFIQFSQNRAALVLKNASVSRKTGRAKPMGKRLGRGADRAGFVVMFWLIRWTKRAARFNQDRIVYQEAMGIPRFVREYQLAHQL